MKDGKRFGVIWLELLVVTVVIFLGIKLARANSLKDAKNILSGGSSLLLVDASFTVNTTVDAVDANIGDGSCATSSGNCTLRAAIQEANALSGQDAITLPQGIYTLTISGTVENSASTGDLDAIVANPGSSESNTVWLNGGEGSFVDSGQNLGALLTTSVVPGDLDSDGDLDVAFINSANQGIRIWLNDGTGLFSDTGQVLGSGYYQAGAIGDLDGDGDLDIFQAKGGTSTPGRVWINNGTGIITDSGQALGNLVTVQVKLADLDNDGDLDAFSASDVGQPNLVWLNDGHGQFSDSGQALGSANGRSVALGDLDGDGDFDAYVGNVFFTADSIWLNDGAGVFTNSGQILLQGTTGLEIGDVDGDGDLDIFAVNGNVGKVLLNNGGGVFTDSGQSLVTARGLSVALGDLDGDGDLDGFIAADEQPDQVWLNEDRQTVFCADVTQIPQSECEVLFTFYVSTGGPNWMTDTNWLETNTPCNWYGVACQNGHVSSLNFWNNQLTGTLPPAIGDLTGLTNLQIVANPIGGTIPEELGNLTQIQTLILDQTQLNGPIPDSIGNLTDLQMLILSRNQLTGTIPAELGYLGNLEILYIWNNDLSGEIPGALGDLSELLELGLDKNRLSGSIPWQLGNLTNLQQLGLFDNQLTGAIPSELGSLTNLQVLHLFQNQLTDTIPIELGDLSALQSLDVGANQLTGPIPSSIGGLADLQELRLDDNQLTGNIPPGLGGLTNLIHLSLSQNQLTGSLPPELGVLSNLQSLSLAANQLTGAIPSQIRQLSSLTELNLALNQLSGSIPSGIGDLSNLISLQLWSNRLSGSLPLELGNLSNLMGLYLAYNALEGEIPAAITNISNLGSARLGYNRLFSTDPTVIDFLSNKEPEWAETQTVPPTDLHLSDITGDSVVLAWLPISYTTDGGYYEVSVATDRGGPFTLYGITADKTSDNLLLIDQQPGIVHYYRIRTFTPAHGVLQQNDLWSDYSEILTAIWETAEPDSAQSMSYVDEEADLTTVEIPAGAMTETATILFTPITTPTANVGFQFAGTAFELTALKDGAVLEGLAFERPVTITIEYSDMDVEGQDELTLRLEVWDPASEGWLDAACGSYDRHPDENWLSVPICHLSLYALFGQLENGHNIYLPVFRYD